MYLQAVLWPVAGIRGSVAWGAEVPWTAWASIFHNSVFAPRGGELPSNKQETKYSRRTMDR